MIILVFAKETLPREVLGVGGGSRGKSFDPVEIIINIRGLGSIVSLFLVATLIYITGVTMVNPFFSLYLKKELGLDMAHMSYFFAIKVLMTLTIAPLDGTIADKIGRKPTFLAGLALTAGTLFGYIIVYNYQHVLLVRALQ